MRKPLFNTLATVVLPFVCLSSLMGAAPTTQPDAEKDKTIAQLKARVNELENEVALLKQLLAGQKGLLPGQNAPQPSPPFSFQMPNPIPSQPDRPRSVQPPTGAIPQPFNGGTYYVIPLKSEMEQLAGDKP